MVIPHFLLDISVTHYIALSNNFPYRLAYFVIFVKNLDGLEISDYSRFHRRAEARNGPRKKGGTEYEV
jgi:hypothetical protein